MKHIGWFIIIWAMLLGFSLQLKAQHISVSAPTHVAAGENFRVAYTINTRDVEEFRLGGVGEGLEVIAGPYTSSQSSYQMINGHTSSSPVLGFSTLSRVDLRTSLSTAIQPVTKVATQPQPVNP